METLGKAVVRTLAIIGACTVVSLYLDCKKQKETLAKMADQANKEKESND